MIAGYSGTPLVKKLGIKPGHRLSFINEPEQFRSLLVDMPEVPRIRASASGASDVIVAFFVERSAFEQQVELLGKAIFPHGSLWVSWPKRASKVPTDMTEDVVREVVLPRGLVDVKVCAIDETWSGLKIMWRKELRET